MKLEDYGKAYRTMKAERINHWLTLLANFGVLLGILVLIYELNQNNVIAKAQTRSDIANFSRENVRMFQSPFALEIARKRTSGEELSFEEVRWMNQAFRAEIRSWENVHYQYRVGLYDENEMESYRVFWRNRAEDCSDLFKSWYEQVRTQIEPNFRAEMDTYLREAKC